MDVLRFRRSVLCCWYAGVSVEPERLIITESEGVFAKESCCGGKSA